MAESSSEVKNLKADLIITKKYVNQLKELTQ